MARAKKLSFGEVIQQKAACYLRVSTEEQAHEGVSLNAQEEKLNAYCLMNNLKIIKTIREEGVSGAKYLSARPGGKELLLLVEKKLVNNIVTLKLDRLFRNTENALREISNWDKNNIALHIVDLGGQTLNTSSAMGRFFITMMAGIAELERNLIAERTSTALEHMKEQRQLYGTLPYGFDIQKGKSKDDPDFLIPNKQEQKTLSLIKDWHKQGWSLRKIAKELTQREIPTKQGGSWYASTVSYLLTNSLYQGN
jgi:site-specific DNA recombinase